MGLRASVGSAPLEEALMKAVCVKYQVDPSFAETNAENIGRVMKELRDAGAMGSGTSRFVSPIACPSSTSACTGTRPP